MNWQEIYEKYPRSWNKLALRFLIRIYDGRLVDVGCEVDNPKLMCNFNLRNLYDFFDEQGISITIEWSHSENPTIGIDWYYEITNFELPAKIFEVNNVYAGTRTMAEEQAFLKAFEILENKLR